MLGVNRYRIYLGTSLTAVTDATATSAEYLGEVTGTTLALARTLAPGSTYYWRVDPVTANGTVAGPVASFTVSSIASDTSRISAATVRVHKNYAVAVSLSSATAGKSWTASGSADWIGFEAATGVTPATVRVVLDATLAKAGVNQGTVDIKTDEGTFSIPVTLQVDPLALTLVRSDPQSPKVYALSEETSTTGATTRAYLLEIDALQQLVTRVVPVGTSATDLALHKGDNRVYVPNWRPGGLLAVNLSTFKVERTLATGPFGGVGYSRSDVYRVSAGTAGRLVVEAEDQWVDVRILDSQTGATLATTNQREGGGQYDPTGRYYFHGDNNSSGSALHKLDTLADKFSEVIQVQSTSVSSYGSRTVVVSEDGSRVFWNGVAFDSALKVLWKTGEELVAASRDGRYAFSQKKIFDIERMEPAGPMPAGLGAFTYNSATGRIVGQSGTALTFFSPFGTSVLGAGLAPKDGAIISTVPSLAWTALPGVDRYRVYLGTSLATVNAATPSSAEYLGETTGSTIAPPAALAVGKTYYWRVDLLIGGTVVTTQSQSFLLSTVVPSLAKVEGVSVLGYGAQLPSVTLTSATSGVAWTASAAAPWIKLAAASGTTPATLQLSLDATKLAAGLSSSQLTVSGAWGELTLPVTVQVDALNLTVLRADPKSSKVYAINEPPPASGTNAGTRAFLLEVDTATEQVTRAVQVGSSATDLAIHAGDNRVYVTNWQPGGILGVSLATFAIERTISTPAYDSYGDNDAYRISAGTAGRLVIEAQDQWINLNLYDTVSGKVLATSFVREGAGQFDPTLRYYYHGDNNISNASLHKYDTLADKFAEIAKSPEGSQSGYGSRSVVVSEDGTRVFWGGRAFDADTKPVWSINDEIYTASKDGRYAVSATKVYDTVQRQVIYGVPAGAGKVSALNNRTNKLVLQNGARVAFYTLDPTIPLPAPALTVGTAAATTTAVPLAWTIDALQSGFTVQQRAAGTTAWVDATTTLAATARTYTVAGLLPSTTYEFRIKADSPGGSSAWSGILTASTAASAPVITQQPASQVATIGGTVTFTTGMSPTPGVTFQWYKNGQPIGGQTGPALTLTGVDSADAGTYYVTVTNATGRTTSQSATLTVGTSRIVNFSIRSTSGAGNQVLVVRFALSGGSKPLLLRGIGPGLAGFGVTGVLADPQLALYSGQARLALNDNWGTAGSNQIAIAAAQVGAFSLAANSLDASLLTTLNPGSYTVQISGPQSAAGLALAEIYDTNALSGARLVNVSARTQVGSDAAALIGGFVITGTGRRTVLVRAVGPSLTAFGVTDTLPDPRIEVIRTSNNTVIGSNDDWGGSTALSSTFAQVGAFGLDARSKDAVLVLTLDAGNYSGVVTGAPGTSGVALLEIYEVAP
ncbi:MAG: immunoglobulin domain-containing protein [Verrucomicrobia bacterium]|nr:immunoglobulin domain-containing protein [Verrucomicrobiota bacterium]